MRKPDVPLAKRPAWKALAKFGIDTANKLAHDSSTNTLIRHYRQRRAGGAGGWESGTRSPPEET